MPVRVVLATVFAVSLAVPAAQTRKSIIVTVVDPSGAAVKTITPADLAVQEDSATREVVDVQPASDPMAIALLVDNTKPAMGKEAPTRELRAALNAFVTTVQAASPESTIGIWEFAGAGVMIQKPTAKADELTKRINRMFPGQQSGGVMLEALVDASKELSKKGLGPRRVILSVSFDSPEISTIDPREVAIAMRKAGVNYWAVSIEPGQDASNGMRGSTASRELIMTNVTTASGGMHDTGVTATSLESQVKRVAEAITSQYVVTYARPDSAPNPTAIQAVSRKGMKVLTAPWVQ
jgi:hypothetical protein